MWWEGSQSSQKQPNLIIAGAFVPHKSVFVHAAPVAVMTVIVLVSALTTHHAEPERPSAASIYLCDLTRVAQSGLVGLMVDGPCRQAWSRRRAGSVHKEAAFFQPSVVWWMFPVMSVASSKCHILVWMRSGCIHPSAVNVPFDMQLRENSAVIC